MPRIWPRGASLDRTRSFGSPDPDGRTNGPAGFGGTDQGRHVMADIEEIAKRLDEFIQAAKKEETAGPVQADHRRYSHATRPKTPILKVCEGYVTKLSHDERGHFSAAEEGGGPAFRPWSGVAEDAHGAWSTADLCRYRRRRVEELNRPQVLNLCYLATPLLRPTQVPPVPDFGRLRQLHASPASL